MESAITSFLSTVVDYAWGMPLVVLLVGGGIFLSLYSGFQPMLGIKHAIQLVCGKHAEEEKLADGQISHFQALSNALAATIGLGNIGGVAVAIHQGGPGAIFWMWVAAFIGMNTKFFECALAVMYRGRDCYNEVQGGPMYVIDKALGPKWKPMAIFFAVCGLVGTMALFQSNQLAAYSSDNYGISAALVGVFCAVFVGIVLRGGLKSIARATSSLVPTMCVFYVICALIILFLNYEKVPGVFALIFTEAFNGSALVGGAEGMAVIAILKIGVKRAAFSNEAGIGTAPMAHGNAKTNEPISEGYVAMLGPFLDTILVCTLTALVILTSVDLTTLDADIEGVLLTALAFETSFGAFGKHFLGMAILLFSTTTMIGMANYNNKCWHYLFKGKKGFGEKTFIAVFCLCLFLGASAEMGNVVNVLDIGFAFMAIPNMIATLILAPRVMQAFKKYKAKYMDEL